MKTIFLSFSILILFPLLSFGQTYELISEQGAIYTPLESFTSITLEKGLESGNFRRWEHEFKFGFDFPFFDKTYEAFTLNESGFGKFSDSDDYNLYLFAADYMAFNPADTPLVSEVRYQYDIVENERVLKLEWHFVGLGWEIENETNLNHFLHYQVWFKENGSIEFHFGNIDLKNSLLYEKGKGILNPDTKEIIGPYIKLTKNNQSIALSGSYDDLQLTNDPNAGVISTLPEWNWMIQLNYKIVSTENTPKNEIVISPSLTKGIIHISNSTNIIDVKLFDMVGQELFQTQKASLDLSTLDNGIYFITVRTIDGIITRKIIKY